jgi:hypothetical protein
MIGIRQISGKVLRGELRYENALSDTRESLFRGSLLSLAAIKEYTLKFSETD